MVIMGRAVAVMSIRNAKLRLDSMMIERVPNVDWTLRI